MMIRHTKFFVIALLLGGAWSAVPGCILPDYCIRLYTPGLNWCRGLEGGMMWPNNHPELAVPVTNPDGGPPNGCLCFNDADQNILSDKTPLGQYEYLIGLIDDAARDECNAFVPLGYDNNCYIEAGLDAPIISIPLSDDKTFDCIGHCDYFNPPPNGTCPVKTPYECNDDEYGNDDVDADSSTDSGSETGSETGIISTPGAFITCASTTCSIDAEYAWTLWDDPSLLAGDAMLVHDPEQGRFVLMAVEPDTIAYALGLRDGDALESIDGVVIDDLDAAIHAYLGHEQAEVLEVRVGRGSRWVDFVYRFE